MLAPLALTTTTWIAIGSGATFLAAVATILVALLTRSVASATRAAVEAVEEPYVIAVATPPEEVEPRQGEQPAEPLPQIYRATAAPIGSFVRIRLWNIGSGPAIVERVSLQGLDGEECLRKLSAGFQPIGAGHPLDLQIPTIHWPQDLGDGTLAISYTHASGRLYETCSAASIGEPTIACLTYERSRK